MKTVVSQKGQVVIPKPLRDRLGLNVGQVLDIIEENGALVVRKVSALDPVEAAWGTLRLGRSTDEVMAELRSDVSHDEDVL